VAPNRHCRFRLHLLRLRLQERPWAASKPQYVALMDLVQPTLVNWNSIKLVKLILASVSIAIVPAYRSRHSHAEKKPAGKLPLS